MRVVLVVRLILVVFNLDEVAVDRVGRQGQGDDGVDGCGLGDDFESPRLAGLAFSISHPARA